MDNDVVPVIVTLMTKLGSALLFGFVMYRFRIIEERDGMSFLAGSVMLPLLGFKTVLVAEFGALELRAILACMWGKFVVASLAIISSFLLLRKSPLFERFMSAGLFSFHVTATNDFVVGIPIAVVFFPERGMSHLTALVLLQNLVFQNVSMVLLEVGTARRPGAHGEVASKRLCVAMARNVFSNPLICAILMAALCRLALQAAKPGMPAAEAIPPMFHAVIDFFTEPYAYLALFLTGASLTDAFEQIANPGSTEDVLYHVGVPVMLCLLKNIACPFVSLSFTELFQKSDPADNSMPNWQLFCFLYSCIPTSNAPLFAAMRAGVHENVIAAAIFMGLILVVPMLIFFAVLFGVTSADVMRDEVRRVQWVLSWLSMLAAIASLAICADCAWHQPVWRRPPLVILAWYALACLLYSLALVAISDDRSMLCGSSDMIYLFTFSQMQCRVWAVLLLVSSVFKLFSARAARAFVLIAWFLPVLLSVVIPPCTLDEACSLRFSRTRHLIHAVFMSVAWVTALALVIRGLMRRHRLADAALDSSGAEMIATPCRPRVPVERRERRPLPMDNTGSIDESLVSELHLCAAASSQAPLTPAMQAERAALQRFILCSFGIAAKTVLLFWLQVCLSWAIYLSGGLSPWHLEARIVENCFEHSQGIFLLLFIVLLFDTPVSQCVGRARAFGRMRPRTGTDTF